MKSLVKVSNIRSSKDVNKIRSALSKAQGIIACQIKLEKGEVDVVYDNYFVGIEDIYEILEDMGYTVL
ncbi:heavy-metal-associated domain-containing protein [Clostridium brassicae]|uniref:Cation transporter n=1 Tax=Clostridium brassicae TaxID=2999072 RepID=A0ABT4DD28_9CLOT|nr:cation transporter [Clostridium brassicae]MCY6960224.1 cation transporter [Clostridium brassicae]